MKEKLSDNIRKDSLMLNHMPEDFATFRKAINSQRRIKLRSKELLSRNEKRKANNSYHLLEEERKE